MDVKNVSVIGAGTMGNGIAQVFAHHGFDVVMIDVKDEFVRRGLGAIDKNLDRLVKKGTIDDKTKALILGRIKGSTSVRDASAADVVVEAAIEDFGVKAKIVKELDVAMGGKRTPSCALV